MNLGFNVDGIPLGDFANESLMDMVNAQPVKDRYEYKTAVIESTLSIASKSQMIQKLYADIISKSHVDFGKIPDSKGDLTSYKYYEDMSQTIGVLNQLLDKNKCQELQIVNDLHDNLVSLRSDFELGYKFDIEFIKLTYCSAVYALHEVIGVCILTYVDYLKSVNGAEFEFKWSKDSNNIFVVNAAKSLNKSFKNGDWQKIMMSFKKDQQNFLGLFSTIGSVTVGSALAGSLSIPWAPIIIAGIILLFFAIRAILYSMYSSAAKLDNYVTVQKELLKLDMDNDLTKMDPKAIAREDKLMSALDSIANFIKTKIFKSDADAQKEIRETDAKDFSKDELKMAMAGSDINIF